MPIYKDLREFICQIESPNDDESTTTATTTTTKNEATRDDDMTANNESPLIVSPNLSPSIIARNSKSSACTATAASKHTPPPLQPSSKTINKSKKSPQKQIEPLEFKELKEYKLTFKPIDNPNNKSSNIIRNNLSFSIFYYFKKIKYS